MLLLSILSYQAPHSPLLQHLIEPSIPMSMSYSIIYIPYLPDILMRAAYRAAVAHSASPPCSQGRGRKLPCRDLLRHFSHIPYLNSSGRTSLGFHHVSSSPKHSTNGQIVDCELEVSVAGLAKDGLPIAYGSPQQESTHSRESGSISAGNSSTFQSLTQHVQNSTGL